MVKPVREGKEATYQDVLDAPEHKVAEIIDGELFLSPRPAAPHALVTTSLVTSLGSRFGHGASPGGWVFLIEPELHFGKLIMVPDIAAWRLERLPDLGAAFITLAPDWLCETLSPSTEKLDRAKKLPRYARAGVGHVWLLHPLLRTLEVLRRHDQSWLQVATHADDEVVRAEPFEELELALSHLWQLLPPPGRVAEPAAAYAP